MNNYSDCSFKQLSECGKTHTTYKTGNEIVSLEDCNLSTKGHMQSLQISGQIEVIEYQLIINRSGLGNVAISEKICPKHRFNLGICWRPTSTCSSHPQPFHAKSVKRRKLSVRYCNSKLASLIEDKYKIHFPIGSAICTKCRICEMGIAKIHNTDLDIEDASHMPIHYTDIFHLLKVSPFKFKITESLVNEISTSTVRYMKGKYKELLSSFNMHISELKAPGQGKEMMDINDGYFL